jgi:hypothetical protein
VLHQDVDAQAPEDDSAKYLTGKVLYNVRYVVSDFEVDTLEKVYLMGTASIGGQTYLVVKGANLPTPQSNHASLILMSQVRAMVPSYAVQPERTINRGVIRVSPSSSSKKE